MNPFFQALNEGYSEDDILGYISKAIPKMTEPIRKASRMGYNTKQIIGYLSKVMNPEQRNLKGQSESSIHGLNAQEDSERTKRGLAMAATAVAAPLAANAARSALSRALPESLKNLSGQAMGNISQSKNQITPGEVPISNASLGQTSGMPQAQNNSVSLPQQPPANNISASIPEPSNIKQPEVKPLQPDEVLNNFGIKDQIDALLKNNSPDIAAKTAWSLMTPIQKKTYENAFKKGEIRPINEIVEEYAKLTPQIENQPEISQTPEVNEKISPEIEKVVEPIKIEKNSIVSSPNGIGEVKEIRNGQAIIDVDGKLHKVKEEDLEPSLYSDDEIADAYDNLMAKIPEKERSGFISWAGYDEDRNVLGFIPRSGKYEELHNISPEEAKMIKEGTGTARTSGEVREGLWVAGEETRGGVISQIIHDRRRLKEAEEKKQSKFDFNLPKPEKQDRGMKPQFDEMAYPRNLSRAREKKAKDEERSRKKKEKDEAKKRKK